MDMGFGSSGMPIASLIRQGRLTRPRRVGVLGPFHAGKTVLLTSLISQIKHHDPQRTSIFGPEVTIAELSSSSDKTDPLPTRSGLPAFEYTTARDRLAHGGWPPKTVSASEYRCQLVRSDDRWRMYDLSLVDWPGERLADLAMIGHKSYQNWSNSILHALQLEVFRPLAEPYLKLERNSLNETDAESFATEQDLSLEYRRLLARFVDHALPFITPSSFLVDLENRYATETLGTDQPEWSVEELVKLSIGTTPGEPIFPIGQDWQQSAPELYGRLENRFEEYVTRVVKPVADALSLCDHLILLVDISSLLESGPRGVEGTTHLFEELLAYINPGTTTTGKAVDWISWLVAGDRLQLGKIRQITVLGTQSDRIHFEDRQAAEGLLHQLVEPLVRKYQVQKRLKMKYAMVAAVNATRSEPIGPDSQRKLTFQHDGQSYEAKTAEVPTNWPLVWEAGDYAFPRPQPRLPVKRTQAPDQFGLGQVLKWILS